MPVSSNLDLVKSIFAEWERGDWSSVDWADPQIEFELVGGLSTGRWVGARKMAEVWTTAMLRAWHDLRAIPEEFRELDADCVLVFLRNEGRGKGSGIEIGGISTKGANVFTIRDGKVKKLVVYWDREDAVAELGLD